MSEHTILEWDSDAGVIGRDGAVFARYWAGNLLEDESGPGPGGEPDWSSGEWACAAGWIAAEEGEPASPVDPGVSFRTFAGAGREALDAALVRVRTAAGGRRVLLRPTAASALSDIPSVRSVANAWGAEDPFGLLLDPAALLTPAMVGKADDHLVRMAEDLVTLAAVRAVVVSDLAVDVATDSDGGLVAVGVGSGRLPLDSLCMVARAAVGAGVPVVLRSGDVAGQVARLGIG